MIGAENVGREVLIDTSTNQLSMTLLQNYTPLRSSPFLHHHSSDQMRNVITQSVVLPAPADILYKMYVNSEMHSAITGGSAEVHAEPGGTFTAFDGMLSGTILHVVKSKLVVQTWRSESFRASDPDTTLILNFSSEGENRGRIDMVHLDVPSKVYDRIKQGWKTHYWNPWRESIMQHA